MAFGQIYHQCPTEIAPPAKYIRFIENYVCVLNKKRSAIETRSNRLKVLISHILKILKTKKNSSGFLQDEIKIKDFGFLLQNTIFLNIVQKHTKQNWYFFLSSSLFY